MPKREVRASYMELTSPQADGEKRIRQQLSVTPQWKSPEARGALASRLGCEPQLVLALQRRDSSLLRKRHLILLAREWG